jgi:hypothetical protein
MSNPERIPMFLAFTAAALVAVAVFQLGALSVKVAVLSIALQGLLVVTVIAVLVALWSRHRGSRR